MTGDMGHLRRGHLGTQALPSVNLDQAQEPLTLASAEGLDVPPHLLLPSTSKPLRPSQVLEGHQVFGFPWTEMSIRKQENTESEKLWL